MPPEMAVMQTLMGIFAGKAVSAMADLAIADELEQEAKTATQIATTLGTHAPSTYRLLRALASAGFLVEHPDGRFSLTAIGELLRTNHPKSLRSMASMVAGGEHFRAWGQLTEAVRTGQIGVVLSENCEVWEYYQRDHDRAAIFNDAMTAFGNSVNQPVAEAYDFGAFSTICDVGGGHAGQLMTIINNYPGLRGILFDQPDVAAGARTRIEAAQLSSRIEAIGGSFFDSVVPGADLYFARWIIHDWSDERAIHILRNIRQVLPAHGRLLLCEIVVGPPNVPEPSKWMDLNMLSLTGGKERTPEEFAALYTAAGFQLTRIIPTHSLMSLIEGVPV